jgi:hypothetical protein
MKYALTMLLLSLFALSAHADLNRQVTYAEAIFACNGLTPDLAQSRGVNIQGFNGGELRVAEQIFSFAGNTAYFLGTPVGTIDSPPTCTTEDAGEPAVPSWNKIDLNSNLVMELNYNPNLPSCIQDIDGGGFLRTNIYTLSVTLANGQVLSTRFQEVDHYASPVACRNP